MNLDDLLGRIRVAQPCPAAWAEMVGDDTRRHCQQCDKTVYDLSRMTPAEIAELVGGEKKVCGRLYRRPDGTIITGQCTPQRNPATVAAAARMAGMAASILGAATLSGCIETPATERPLPKATPTRSVESSAPAEPLPVKVDVELTTESTETPPELIDATILMGDICIDHVEPAPKTGD